MNSLKIKQYQLLSISASTALISGVFLPILSIPFLGDQTFYQNQQYISIFIIINAILISLISFTRLKMFLWLLALMVSGSLIYAYTDFQGTMSEFDQMMGDGVASEFIKKMKNSFMASIEIKYGVYFLILGVLLTFISAAWKK